MVNDLDDDEIDSLFGSDSESVVDEAINKSIKEPATYKEKGRKNLQFIARVTKNGMRHPVVVIYLKELLQPQFPDGDNPFQTRLDIDDEMQKIVAQVDVRMDELVEEMVEKDVFHGTTWGVEMQRNVGIRLSYFIGWCILKEKFPKETILPVGLNYISFLDEYVHFLINFYNANNASSFNKKVRSAKAKKQPEILKRLTAQTIRGYANKAAAGLFLFGLNSCKSYASHMKKLNIAKKVGKERGHLSVTNWALMDLDVYHIMRRQIAEQNAAIIGKQSAISTTENKQQQITWVTIGCLSRLLAFLFLTLKGFRFASVFGSSKDASGQLKFCDVKVRVVHYPVKKYELEFSIGRRKKNEDANSSLETVFVSQDHEFDFVRLFMAYMILLDVFEPDSLTALKTGIFKIKDDKSDWFIFPRVHEDLIFPSERHDRYSDSVLRNLTNYLHVPKRSIIASSSRKGFVFKLFLEEMKSGHEITKNRILEMLANTPQWKGQVPRSYFKTATTNFTKIRETHDQYYRQAKIEGKQPPSPYSHCPLLIDVVMAIEKNSTEFPSNSEIANRCSDAWEKKRQNTDLSVAKNEIEFLLSQTLLNAFSTRRLHVLQKFVQKFESSMPRVYLEQYKARLTQKMYDKVANDVVAEAYLTEPRVNVILDLEAVASRGHNKCNHTSYNLQHFSPTPLETSPIFCIIKGCNIRLDEEMAGAANHIKSHFENGQKQLCKYCDNHEVIHFNASNKHFRNIHWKRHYCEICKIYDTSCHKNKKNSKCNSSKEKNAVALIFNIAKCRPCHCPIDSCVAETNVLTKFLNLHTLDIAAQLSFPDVYFSSPRKAQELAFAEIAKTLTKRDNVPCAIQLFRVKYGKE